MSKPERIAVLFSDLHLTLQMPSCRNDEDWQGVQWECLNQIKAYGLPVVCAGDIFDRWNPSPELINRALAWLPDKMICVPGQHDLPLHRIDLMDRSGYGVLKSVGKIIDLSRGGSYSERGFTAYGFGWNEPIKPPKADRRGVQLAVVHRYCWKKDCSYPGAPEEANVSNLAAQLKGYDAAVIGDNHKGFLITTKQGTSLLNSGGFIRRKSDEMDYRPGYGILYSDGSIERAYLRTDDKFHPKDKVREEVPFDMSSFVERLGELGDSGMDFRVAVEEHLKSSELDDKTKEIILTAMEP